MHKDDILKKGRISQAAFLPNPGEQYLSVNSVEIESYEEIAKYYRNALQKDDSRVAVATKKISEFNKAAESARIEVRLSEQDNRWKYAQYGQDKDAYSHRPTPKSYSHCGVEYMGSDVEYETIKKIARRLVNIRQKLIYF